MPSIDVNGTTLQYVEYGQGQPVMFVHGALTDMRGWKKQLETFSSRYRAVACSCRYYHPNEQPAGDATLDLRLLAEDLATFVRALDLAPAHFVGSSSGAFVCLLLARDAPDLVRTLVLAEPPVLPLLGVEVPPMARQLLKLLFTRPKTAVQVAAFGATGIGPAIRAFERGEDERGVEIFARAVLGRHDYERLSREMREEAQDNAGALKAQLRSGLPPFGEQAARGIRAPVLLVTGERSAPVHHRAAERLEGLLPDVQRLHFVNASHLMFRDEPDAFSRAVLAFLERQR